MIHSTFNTQLSISASGDVEKIENNTSITPDATHLTLGCNQCNTMYTHCETVNCC